MDREKTQIVHVSCRMERWESVVAAEEDAMWQRLTFLVDSGRALKTTMKYPRSPNCEMLLYVQVME